MLANIYLPLRWIRDCGAKAPEVECCEEDGVGTASSEESISVTEIVAFESVNVGVDNEAPEFRRLLPPSSLVTDRPLEGTRLTSREGDLSWYGCLICVVCCCAVLDRDRLSCSAPSACCGELVDSCFLFVGDVGNSGPQGT
jgi:hypothetical protein